MQKCDLSINNLVEITPLKDMTQLVFLNLAKNKIKACNVFCNEEAFPNLKWLDLSNNKFLELSPIKCPKLEYLDISYNKLEKVNEGWTGHANIRIMKSVDNKFKSLQPFKAMPRMEELYMSANLITALSGWESLPVLKKLVLRRNQISKIDEELPPLPELEYISLRGNKIPNMEVLERLNQFPSLKDINVLNNPVEQNASSFNMLVAEVLIKRPKIARFCKHKITEANQLEAVHLAKFKWQKSEEERKRKEEEEKGKDPKEE